MFAAASVVYRPSEKPGAFQTAPTTRLSVTGLGRLFNKKDRPEFAFPIFLAYIFILTDEARHYIVSGFRPAEKSSITASGGGAAAVTPAVLLQRKAS
ncbi:hypothetical protein NQ012_05930 [Neisseria dentiae]|nr:hypothetical protein [Neisseria dentiae]